MNHVDLTKGIPRDCITCDGPDCEERGPEKRCSRCRTQYYCSVACQKAQWREHKPFCFPLETMQAKCDQDAPPLDQSVLQEKPAPLDPEVDCPICLSCPMEQPVTLKACKHSFCTKCVIEWQKLQGKFSRDLAPCPLCRAGTEDVETSLLDRAALLAGEANMRKSLNEEEKNDLRKEAIACLDRLFDNPDVHLQAYLSKAQILIGMGGGEEAVRVMEAFLLENTRRLNHTFLTMIEEQEAAERRGDIAESERLKELCVQYYDQHGGPPQRVPPNAMFDIHVLRSKAYEVNRDWIRALECSLDAMQMVSEPSDASPVQTRKLFMSIARCAYMAGDYEKSLAASDASIEMNRHFDEVHKFKALSLRKMGNLDEAVKTMNQAVLYETPWRIENVEKALELYHDLVAERES